MSRTAVVSVPEVWEALRGVVDPELDESLVDLGFVDDIHLDGETVTVALRLPTFWCAPNFAYLMARDARDRLLEVAGVGRVRVILKDHFASDEISSGVTEGRSLDEIFPGDAEGSGLDDLRDKFRRKAFGMRQEQLIRALLDAGMTPEEIVRLRIGDLDLSHDGADLVLRVHGERRLVPRGADLARTYLARRRDLGLDRGPGGRLVTDGSGCPIASGDLLDYLRRTRRQRVSMAFNAALCRGLLETRYGAAGAAAPEREPVYAHG
jgi:metal-sulfur cluster biosynthetic enzyme